MNPPFTLDQFLQVFADYNISVWPAQIVIYLLALVLLLTLFKKGKHSDKVVAAILGLFWLWMGIVYHLIFFSSINPAARIFGSLFIVQGLLFIIIGVFKNKLCFKVDKYWQTFVGFLLITTGLIIYPLISYLLGHFYPNSPTFGLPCPTTIFTFGVILLSVRFPKYLLIIPFVWSIIGFSAAFNFNVREDTLLLLAGIIATGIIVMRKGRGQESVTSSKI